jgi:uncharacterized protein (TIGR03083 family)
MEIDELYEWGHQRLLDLAVDLSDDEAATPAPALPGWTVKDTYAHLAGACTDLVDGRSDGVATAPWTARQVEERRDRSLEEVCEEWSRRKPALLEMLRVASPLVRLTPVDLWAHTHDIRGALGRPADRDCGLTMYAVNVPMAGYRASWQDTGLDPINVVTPTKEWSLGEGEPVATLRTETWELGRMLLGRRSRDQMTAMNWTGDPEPFVDHLHVFGPAAYDVIE